MIHSHRFAGAKVLRIAVATVGKLAVPFVDWRVSQRKVSEREALPNYFNGCGVYGVCFRGRLVYVGSYCGQKPRGITTGAYYTGDIAKNRWWQHFGSLTARSHKLHVARRVFAELRESLGEHPMLLLLENAGQALHTDDGCLGAKNRMLFAAKNWSRFNGTSAPQLLRQFSFLYARDDGNLITCTPVQLQKAIENAETEAICAIQPEVNTAKRSRSAVNRCLSSRSALAELASTLNRHLEPHRAIPAAA